MRLLRVPLLCAALVVLPGWPVAAQAPEGARDAAERFGSALVSSRSATLREVLPSQGKVRLTLRRLGPEEGSFAAGQVEALFRDFLASGRVRSFSVASVDSDGKTSALVVARAEVVDREGHPARVGFRLSLEPEAGRWILREVRETAE